MSLRVKISRKPPRPTESFLMKQYLPFKRLGLNWFSHIFSCVDTFCDPLSAKTATIPDLMICAPWSQTMFGCLADGKDHSDCCTARGVPDICGPICSGNATTVTFRHFK